MSDVTRLDGQPRPPAVGGLIEREAVERLFGRWIDIFGGKEIRHTSAREYARDMMDDLLDNIRILPAAQPAQRVKPLAWRPYGYQGQGMEASACGLETFYRIDGKPGDWTLTSPRERSYVHTSGYATRADAQAAATVDFERRMTAHMDPTAPNGAEVAMAECQAFSAGYEAGEKATAGGEELAKLRTEVERLRAVLAFYGDISKYPAPLTGGAGELYFDCGQRARAALRAHEQGEG